MTTMYISVQRVDDGYELGYRYGDGPVCLGPEGSPVYKTLPEAQAAQDRELQESYAWDRAGLADAPHLDAF